MKREKKEHYVAQDVRGGGVWFMRLATSASKSVRVIDDEEREREALRAEVRRLAAQLAEALAALECMAVDGHEAGADADEARPKHLDALAGDAAL